MMVTSFLASLAQYVERAAAAGGKKRRKEGEGRLIVVHIITVIYRFIH
jgi:hypothetical protein